jgi:hypothetical protein
VKDLLAYIDSVPMADIPWQSFDVSYTEEIPAYGAPRWMFEKFECHFRDPRLLVRQMLANRNFDGHFDDAAYQKFNKKGKRTRKDFMSADYVWYQSVSAPFIQPSSWLTYPCRRNLVKILRWQDARL